jgi:hypothetical protein
VRGAVDDGARILMTITILALIGASALMALAATLLYWWWLRRRGG